MLFYDKFNYLRFDNFGKLDIEFIFQFYNDNFYKLINFSKY